MTATDKKTGKSCRSCFAGLTYNDKRTGRCENCQMCTGKKVEVKACSLTSNTVCKCPKGTYEGQYGDCVECSYCCGSNWEQSKKIVPECQKQGLGRCVCSRSSCSRTCSAPTTAPKMTTTAPKTTPKATTTAPKMTATAPKTTPKVTTKVPITTRKIYTTKSSKRTENPKQNSTQGPLSTSIFKSPVAEFNHQNKPVRWFLNAGWIVLFCVLAVAIILLAVMGYKRAPKQISCRCCGKYGELTTEGDVTSALVEGRYEEQATGITSNNAIPIPPWEEPVPITFSQSSSNPEDLSCNLRTENRCCNCRSEHTENEQMQCACTIRTSETTLEILAHTPSTAEKISEEFQHCGKDRNQERQTSPSRFSSSRFRVPSPLSEHYCVTSSSSNCSTPSPPRGRSPARCCVTPPLPLTCVTPCQPYMQSPERSLETSFSNSTCVTPSTACGGSPEHRRLTPSLNSSCGPQTSSYGPSSEPSSLSSLQSQSDFSEDQEIYVELRPIPVSVESSDKEHDLIASAATTKNTSPARQLNEGHSVGEKKSPKAKKNVTCVRRCDLQPPKQTEVDTDEEIRPSPASDRGADCAVMIGSSKIKANITVNPQADGCKYRPIHRNNEHRCHECCPQPDDSFFQLINRERLCLKEQICTELSSSYKPLAIAARVGKDMAEFETSLNSAESVLDRIKASFPETTLSEFETLLGQIERRDIVQLIQNHHLSCTLCQRNRFDSKA